MTDTRDDDLAPGGDPGNGSENPFSDPEPEQYDSDATRARAVEEEPSFEQTAAAQNLKPARGPHMFSEGNLIAGRYTVLRFLAQGGMGEVYEVEDKDLGETVALKTILPRIASNPVALERFRREMLLARKVTHPNVCRLFDIGRHAVRGKRGKEQVTFLTMELLRGESLGQRLRRGEMTTDEALPLVRQVASGLAAAHRAGVVHRDLKPANIFVEPSDEGDRAVVTDFGLARIDAEGMALADVTGTGEILGTPAYMAPEQLEGLTPTAATDIYAFGLVMYEMLTGARAFDGDTAFQMALKRLQEPPTRPSHHIPDIDPVWEKTILRCLEKEPDDRFDDADDIGRALAGEIAVPGVKGRWKRTLREAMRSPMMWLAVAVVGIVAGLVMVRGPLFGPESGEQDVTTQRGAPARQSVAVLGFENVTSDPEWEWISTALSEILTTELGVGGALRTIPGETVARARTDLGIDEITTLGDDTLKLLRGNLGSDYVVLGSYIASGDTLRFDIRVQATESGAELDPVTATGSTEGFLALAESAGISIRRLFDVEELGAEQRGAVLASLPSNAEAARLYSEGVAKLRAFDPLAATELLTRAAEADPESAVIYSQLAKAWTDLGYDGRALQAAKRAFELSGDLGREEGLWIEGQYNMAANDWKGATNSFSSLWQFHPDNLEYGLQLADAEIRAGDAEAALDTVAELRRLKPPASEDPRIDIREADVAQALGRAEDQLSAAQRAAASAEVKGASLLVGESKLAATSALIELSRFDEAKQSGDQALEIFRQKNNQAGVASAVYSLAVVAIREGDLDRAEDRLRDSLDSWRRLGNRVNEAKAINTIGSLRLQRGDLEGATASFQEALGIGEEIDNKQGIAMALNNMALVLRYRGDLVGATDHLERVSAVEREIGNRSGEARALENLAGTYAAGGDLVGARRSFERAIGLYRELDSRRNLASALYWLGEVLLWQGELNDAGRRHQEALELRIETGEKLQIAMSEFALAGVKLQEAFVGAGDFGQAVRALEPAVDSFRELDLGAQEALALSYLADARLATGDTGRAQVALTRAKTLTAAEDDISTRLDVAISHARLSSAQRDFELSLEALRTIVETADRAALLGTEFEARLALGEVEIASGRVREGRDRLEELRQEATARGWILVADKAREALESSGTEAS